MDLPGEAVVVTKKKLHRPALKLEWWTFIQLYRTATKNADQSRYYLQPTNLDDSPTIQFAIRI